MLKDALGDRMKGYENVNRNYLMRRTPVIIRVDGKAFHSFTKGLKKPFDDVFALAMQDTMKYLCENIQGCVLGYTQSDEISLVLIDYQTLTTSSWFDYNIQKCVSVAAAMATLAFNRAFDEHTYEYIRAHKTFNAMYVENTEPVEMSDEEKETAKYIDTLQKAFHRGGVFDARIFNVPKEEVCNCILWRQNDATRNSIETVGQCVIGHSGMVKLNCNQVQDKLLTEHNINWNNFPTKYKRGSCCVRKEFPNGRSAWVIDNEIPIFKNEGREYIESLINVGE